MKITLKDGSVKEYQQPMAIIDIARDLSEGLARVACVGVVDGETKDLRTVLDHDCTLNICTANDPEGLAALRHSASHVMAQAIKRLYPSTKLAIGPSIADGFYYDLDPETPFTADDMEKVEAEMKKIVKEAFPIERFTLPREEAIAVYEGASGTLQGGTDRGSSGGRGDQLLPPGRVCGSVRRPSSDEYQGCGKGL